MQECHTPRRVQNPLFDESPQAILILDREGKITEANPSAQALMGRHDSGLVGCQIRDFMFPVAGHPLPGPQGELPESIECHLRSLAGQELIVEFKSHPYLVDSVPHRLCFIQNVSEKRCVERFLNLFAHAERDLNSIINCEEIFRRTADLVANILAECCGFYFMDEGSLRLVAAAHRNANETNLLWQSDRRSNGLFLGLYDPRSVFRSGLSEFRPHISAPAHTEGVLPCGSLIALPIRQKAEVAGVLYLANFGEISKFSHMDLTVAEELAGKVELCIERAAIYETLEEMRDAANAANEAKTHFLANVSHEIRTPLSAILGFIELILSPGYDVEERALWEQKVRNNSRHLLRIINDILDLSKVESGQLEMSLEEISLEALLSDVSSAFAMKARKKGIQFGINYKTPVPRAIQTDGVRVSQILYNVIGNAIKFTSQGRVTVDVSHMPKPGTRGEGLLRFDVSDTGPGLTPEEASRLFRPFSQADVSHTREFGGTGLGLALSKRLAGRLGGDVVLERSERGKGSTFSVMIDAGNRLPESFLQTTATGMSSPQESPGSLAPERLDGVNVLLVEDSPDNQILVKRFLEGAGAKVELAGNGDEGVRLAQSKAFDVILMDIQMPVKDGYAAASELRQNGYIGPIIALTAYAMKDHQDRCSKAGCDSHISKPVRRSDLLATVKKFAGLSAQS